MRLCIPKPIALPLSWLFVIWFWQCACADVPREREVRIVLRPVSLIDGQQILRLGDVAEIETSNRNLAEQLKVVDLAEWPQGGDEFALSKKLVFVRLRLANIEGVRFAVDGPDEIVVKRRVLKNTEQSLLAAIRTEFADRWTTEVSSVRCRFMQPLSEDVLRPDAHVEIDQVEVSLPSTVRPGRNRVTVLAHSEGRLIRSHQVAVEAQLYAEVAIAKRTLERGQVIRAEDIQTEWQSVNDLQAGLAADDIVGKVPRTTLRRGQPILDRHLTSTRRQSTKTVRSRDTVRLVVQRGGLKIIVNDAVALQSGQVGDRIRVRNPRSNSVLMARIVSSTEVRVD